MSEHSLDGVGVLVTRPRQQADELVEAIEARGGTAILFPVIDILARDPIDVQADLDVLGDPAITVFVSRNAVEHGLVYAGGQVAAIGPTTAEAIRQGGGHVDICPATGFDSEHLLKEAAFDDVAGKTIRVVRGNDGREHLGNALSERGANVEYLSTYERKRPHYTAAELSALEQRWQAGDITVAVVMSVQSLENLGALLPEWCRKQLPLTPLVTPAARVLQEALKHYPGCPAILAAGPRNNDIVDAIAR
jgi:uroporphyrinogen-III synthase